ncbi:MAG: hypothetical protein ACMUHY_06210, partial [Thermoplasmatota archaeon]
VVDLDNPYILAAQLACAAAELPLDPDDGRYFGSDLDFFDPECCLYSFLPSLIGIGLIVIGIKNHYGKVREWTSSGDGEQGVFGNSGGYEIECAFCGEKHAIKNPRRPVRKVCRRCNRRIRTRIKEGRIIQDHVEPVYRDCPRCKGKIVLRNTITPLIIICPECHLKIGREKEGVKKKRIKPGTLECPKCLNTIEIPEGEDSGKFKCPECGAKIRIVGDPR